ncbi:hypothetical protein C1T17_04495 [Sphingobium sp. SCG-1]|uniref:hypothetical protein n=1 Tax=Sphingobium sp. SCG-1 TaxID=2072936 RepID=UPI000CD69DB5|nr:hypothetical protein [Sphingobium sp. SCG-1]AUW57470.1 hypothetical protein C1T17_04495 [Sphingobium sp. SCG-1]
MSDAALMFIAIAGSLLAGLGVGPILGAGQVVMGAWWPFILAAAFIAGAASWFCMVKWRVAALSLWTLIGSMLSVFILCGMAAQTPPRLVFHTSNPPAAGPREPLGLHTGLDLFWGSSQTLSALDTLFKVDRLDVLSPSSLQFKQRLLLAQPRLLAPEELVALDDWVRGGGRAVILADPLLVWPSDLPLGDRRRPPVTSLLDPLLTRWGLVLEPAQPALVERRFVEGNRLLLTEGASHFTTRHSDFARCQQVGDGFMVTCRVGEGKVRLIADADLLDERLWQSSEGERLMSDTMALLDRWLRRPLSPATEWPNAINWVRNEADVKAGLRWALLVALLWAFAGAAILAQWRGRLKPFEGR